MPPPAAIAKRPAANAIETIAGPSPLMHFWRAPCCPLQSPGSNLECSVFLLGCHLVVICLLPCSCLLVTCLLLLSCLGLLSAGILSRVLCLSLSRIVTHKQCAAAC